MNEKYGANQKLILIILMSFLLMACTVDQSQLEKVKGNSLTYSEYFKHYDRLDERENLQFYKPVSLDQVILSELPNEMENMFKVIDTKVLPFEVDEEEVYFMTSKNNEGTEINQVQVSYLGKNEYDSVDDFFILSITEANQNPLLAYDIADEVDSTGNQLTKESLSEDLPIYHQNLTTDSALLYRYYDYDEKNKKVSTVGTAANELYAYYNGYIYHVGYLIGDEKNDANLANEMLQIFKDYILEHSS